MTTNNKLFFNNCVSLAINYTVCFHCTWYEYVLLNLMFPFELLRPWCYMLRLCGHFKWEKQDMSACITVVWDVSTRRSKINGVPFHIKVSFICPATRRDAARRCENVKSRSNKAGRGEMPGAIPVSPSGGTFRDHILRKAIKMAVVWMLSIGENNGTSRVPPSLSPNSPCLLPDIR